MFTKNNFKTGCSRVSGTSFKGGRKNFKRYSRQPRGL